MILIHKPHTGEIRCGGDSPRFSRSRVRRRLGENNERQGKDRQHNDGNDGTIPQRGPHSQFPSQIELFESLPVVLLAVRQRERDEPHDL